MILNLGEHTLACGNSTDKEFVKKVIGDASISSLLVDPPYGIAIADASLNQTSHKPLVNDHLQSDEEYAKFTRDWLEAVKPFLAKKNSAYVWNADKMVFALRQGMLQSGFKISQMLVWVKSQPVIGRLDYLPMNELCLYGWYDTHKFYKANVKRPFS